MNVSLSQHAYEKIRKKIISLELMPGGVIDESVLRDELGVGRTPIREALQRLAREKLVYIMPRRGMFVTEIGVTELRHLFEMRVELEGLAARLAAERGKAHYLEQMAKILGKMPAFTPTPNNHTLVHLDEQFHHCIYEMAGNSFLQDTLTTLYTLSLRLWHYFLADVTDMQQAISEHRLIMEAIEVGNGDLADSLMQAHVKGFQNKIQMVMLGEMPASRKN
jgi:DNA-binding GntR family transcriptional regulator